MAHILLAEDDHSMRKFLVLALQNAGHTVTDADNGLDALSLLKAQPDDFDLLLADIVMPGMDGIELSQKATDIKAGLKVMFITGFAAVAMNHKTSSTQDESVKSNVISKPFHLRDLVGQVDDLLAA